MHVLTVNCYHVNLNVEKGESYCKAVTGSKVSGKEVERKWNMKGSGKAKGVKRTGRGAKKGLVWI